MAAYIIDRIVGRRGSSGGVDGYVLFGGPDTVEELVHVHRPEVLTTLAEGVLELVESEGVDRGFSSKRREEVVLRLLIGW